MGRYKSLLALNVSAFLLMLGVGMIVALLPQKIMDLSHSVAAVGYLAASFAISYVLTQIPIGNLADKIGWTNRFALLRGRQRQPDLCGAFVARRWRGPDLGAGAGAVVAPIR